MCHKRIPKNLAQAIASSSAYSVAGGGDTIAAISKFKVEKIYHPHPNLLRLKKIGLESFSKFFHLYFLNEYLKSG